MSRTWARALVLANWKGVFYERYLIDRHVTALEGANGAGKTTVMIAAYVVLLPDMSRLRFTNLGETGATGGDKGIWGRLGESGRPAYSAIEFALASGQRLIAGVHLERKGEPSVEPTPFIISGLDMGVRLQDVFLLSLGDHDVVPELNELRENAARLGGRLQVFGTARDYFAVLFDQGVMPLRLATDEERNKLNEMLRTSMTGGISRALTSELRSFLLKEETGLADTLQRMKANLDACKRTRTEVQEAQQLEREIGGVFEAGQTMFAAAFFATRERADELRRRLTEAEDARRKGWERLAEAKDQLARVHDDLGKKAARQEALVAEVKAAEDWLQRLHRALQAAEEVEQRREELSSSEADTRIAEAQRKAREQTRSQCRAGLHCCREDDSRARAGLADLQRGLDELHRRAGAYRQVLRRKGEVERLLEVEELAIGTVAARVAESRATLDQVDRSRRDARQRLADADQHRRDHRAALEALELMAEGPVEVDTAHSMALQQLRRYRDLEALAGRLSTIAAELAEARKFASRQAKAREQAEKLGISLSGQRSARIEITEPLEQTELERERLLDQAREAQANQADCQRTLDVALARQKELDGREPIWRALALRAQRLADELGCPLTSLPELKAAHQQVGQHLTRVKASESELVERRESLQSAARELLAVGGPFDTELLRLKDTLGAELLAGVFEDASVEDAAVVEARLGALVQALVVDDPVTAAKQVHGRPDSLSDVWLVSRDEDVARLGADAVRESGEATDVIVSEPRAIRVTRIPTRPRLGRKAREKRAAELRAVADTLDAQLENTRVGRRRFERLAEDGEALLVEQRVWLAGDPAPELAAIGRQLSEIQEQRESHRAAVTRFQEAARQLAPRIEALRGLLGSAVLLDPPDHAQRRDDLGRDHDAAQAAQAEIQRCRQAARVVEGKLDTLRRTPLSEVEVTILETELTRLSDERDRLDAAIEAMEFIAVNAEALRWDDAPVQLEENRLLIPALEEQLHRAEEALNEAGAAVEAAEQAFESATANWQDADGRRRAAVEQLRAAERRFNEMEIPDPTEAAVATAHEAMRRLEEEATALAAELTALNTTKGRCEAEQAQAAREYGEAEEKVAAERREAEPALDRWERLRAAVVERNLLASVVTSGTSDVSGIRGHVNLVQEAHKQRAVLVERLRAAHGAQDLLAKVDKNAEGESIGFADVYLELWLAVRDWLRRRLPAQVAEVDDPREALLRLRDQLTGLEERLSRQEKDLRGASEDVARGIDVQIRKARGQVSRLNQNLNGVSFGSIEGVRVKVQSVGRMEQVLRALRDGAVQGLLFQENLPIEEALDEIFRRYGGGRSGGQRLLDYREYVHLQVEIRRTAAPDWEAANPIRLSTGEAIGVGAVLMMVVLTEWERNATLLRGKRAQGSLRFLFLDEANRLSHDNLGVLFDLCQTLELQLLIAAPEVARAEGNTTYRLVRRVDADGREKVCVSGRRTRAHV
ncbi:chromosome partition protein MukB [Marichromatium sp. AB31]|uniref:chromosome partition protein MukB n=1 Tax=Marichromatium sp. AB31 TaxID=2483362 RepID=UPI000F3FC2D4|nr:chromosome partition protein MukB [Marichromatium sp. AB31]RNE91010.1 chromosome partition protein MukB [Marichromatium sp. AB31]